jgi:ribonuclease HI
MYKLFTDGGSRGNPGNAAIGFFIFNEKNELINLGGKFIGTASNNVAEYSALIEGLKLSLDEKIDEITCCLDSELVVKQLKGEYKIKHADMKVLSDQVNILKKEFKTIEFVHVPRAENKFADRLVNIVLDEVERK